MEIEIRKHIEEKTRVIIECKEVTNNIQKLQSYIRAFDNRILTKKEDEMVFVEMSDILYFETVDNRTFLYTKDEVVEVKQRLYELEARLSEEYFFRCSKSIVVNINKIKNLKPQIDRTIMVTMCNGEKLTISRRYVKAFKDILGIQERAI